MELNPNDPILTLLGPMPDEEFQHRRRIHSCREIASHRIANTESASAKPLLWMLIEWASANIYSAAPVDHLGEVASFCRRLLILAQQAERIEVPDGMG